MHNNKNPSEKSEGFFDLRFAYLEPPIPPCQGEFYGINPLIRGDGGFKIGI